MSDFWPTKFSEENLPPEIREQNKWAAERAAEDARFEKAVRSLGPRLGYHLGSSPFMHVIIRNAVRALPNGSDEELYKFIQNGIPFAYRSN